jgi:hypothetical protein
LTGTLARAKIIDPGFVNHEAEDDPEDADRQLTGPAGFLATCIASEFVQPVALRAPRDHRRRTYRDQPN